MTIKENCQFILRKYPETKFNRAEFMWKYICEFYGAVVYILKDQFIEFWKDEPSIERELRDLLKTDEFKLPVEQESKRYEKKTLFQQWYKNLADNEKQDFNKAFKE